MSAHCSMEAKTAERSWSVMMRESIFTKRVTCAGGSEGREGNEGNEGGRVWTASSQNYQLCKLWDMVV